MAAWDVAPRRKVLRASQIVLDSLPIRPDLARSRRSRVRGLHTAQPGAYRGVRWFESTAALRHNG
jgi:hypothetical protein